MLLAIVQRMWAREQDRRLRRVKCFSFAAARCSSEDDRPVVGGNVVRMLVQTCNISEFDSRTRALECFDAVVRMLLPQAMQASSLSYKHCVIVALAFLARALDILASDVLAGEEVRVIVTRFVYWISAGLVGFPQCARSSTASVSGVCTSPAGPRSCTSWVRRPAVSHYWQFGRSWSSLSWGVRLQARCSQRSTWQVACSSSP